MRKILASILTCAAILLSIDTRAAFPSSEQVSNIVATAIAEASTNYAPASAIAGASLTLTNAVTNSMFINGLLVSVGSTTAYWTNSSSFLTATFYDLSAFNPTNWFWDFGDGAGTSTNQNPVYTYSTAGTYTVVETVLGNGISGSVVYTNSFTNTVTAVAPYNIFGSLIHYYSFDADDGTDAIGTATLSAAGNPAYNPAYSPGVIGDCISTWGLYNTEYDDFSLMSSFTINVWMDLTYVAGNGCIPFGLGNSYATDIEIGSTSGDFVQIMTGNSWNSTPNSVNGWHMYTVVYTGIGIDFYIDGAIVLTGLPFYNASAVNQIYIGYRRAPDTYSYGKVDELSLYNSDVASEISWLYNGGAGQNSADTVAHFNP